MNERDLIAILAYEEMRPLAENVATALKNLDPRYAYVPVEYTTFANREMHPHVTETIRSMDTYLLCSLFHPDPNTGLIKLFLTCNAISLASPKSLVLVIPYIPYLRQDRKNAAREPISARLVADLIMTAGGKKLDGIVTMDMHVEQEEGLFDIPVDNIPGRILFAEYFRKLFKGDFTNVVVVAPDIGGALRAKRLANMIGARIGILEKERGDEAKVTTQSYTGESLKGKDAILIDDMIDTGNTTIAGMEEILRRKAKRVFACSTHAIFSPKGGSTAEEKLKRFGAPVIVTTSIPRPKAYYAEHSSWLTALPIDQLLVKVIYESDRPGGSVSACLR